MRKIEKNEKNRKKLIYNNISIKIIIICDE